MDGIGVVNLLHSDGEEFYPIDLRLYAPDQDGKSKNQHFLSMLRRAKQGKGLRADTVLFDAWYASVENLKAIHRLGMAFVTTLKSNRLVSTSREAGYAHLGALAWATPTWARWPGLRPPGRAGLGYAHLGALAWDADSLRHGRLVKLRELPLLVRLFKLVAPNGDIDWVITNRKLQAS